MVKKKDGMTMVEVIVAFAVLMIGLAGMYKVTLLSWNMVSKASFIQKQVDELMNQYYEGTMTENTIVEGEIQIQNKDGTVLDKIPAVIKDVKNDEDFRIYYYADTEEGEK